MDFRLSVLPLLGVSLLGFSLCLALLLHWNSYWKKYARSFFRAVLLVSLMSLVQFVLLSVRNGFQANFVYSIALPLVCLEQLSVIDAFLTIFDLQKPFWFTKLWSVVLIFLAGSVVFHADIYPIFHQVPDGYWFASPKSDVVFTVLKSFVYVVNLISLVCVVLYGVRCREHRKRWPYLVSILSFGVCLINDSVVFQHVHTLYPTTWIAAIVFFGMLWREVRWHMQDVYKRLDRDLLTGAYSRSFGEHYLAELLSKQDVGLFYADFDNFKEVNDTFGHQAGDEILKSMVRSVQSMMDMPNALVRLGGDEFLFIFPNAGSNAENNLRREIYASIDGMTMFQGNDSGLPNPQVSLGWEFVKRGSSWMQAIHEADLSMYLNKETKTGGMRK